jgi:hypothetical protein
MQIYFSPFMGGSFIVVFLVGVFGAPFFLLRTQIVIFNPLPSGIKSLRATLPDEIFTGDFAS